MDTANKTQGEAPRDAEVKPFPARPEAEAPQPPAAQAKAEPPAKKGGARRLIRAAALVALGFGLNEGYGYWTVGRFLVSTDDAYLKSDITAIAPKVQGYIEAIPVHENQKVTAGEVLMRLDDGDYQNALKTAQSQVATEGVTIKQIAAQVEAARAAVAQAQAAKVSAEAAKVSAEAGLKNAQTKFDRTTQLAQSSVATQSAVDDAQAALDQAQAAVNGADAAITGANAAISAAEANVNVLEAQKAVAESSLASLRLAVDQAQRNLDRTILRAPVDGTVANLSVHEGDLVSPGQKIAAVVPTDAIYVEANYKETQLPGIAPGETVQVTIDALPDQSFTGTVMSLAPATGSQFSLLPPQNATGNFTKVVQRVPVRISLPAALLASGRLHSGLSAVVSVDSRTKPQGN